MLLRHNIKHLVISKQFNPFDPLDLVSIQMHELTTNKLLRALLSVIQNFGWFSKKKVCFWQKVKCHVWLCIHTKQYAVGLWCVTNLLCVPPSPNKGVKDVAVCWERTAVERKASLARRKHVDTQLHTGGPTLNTISWHTRAGSYRGGPHTSASNHRNRQ